jgi:hypothetical protein
VKENNVARTYIARLTAAFLISASVAGGAVGLSTAQQSPAVETLQAGIFATSCADLTGTAVETLDNLLLDDNDGSGEFRGLPSAMTVLESDSDVDISLSTLLDSPHSIVIGDPNTPVACGDIGGFIRDDSEDDDGFDLVVGLMPWGDSGYFGIAQIEGDNNIDDDDDDDDDGESEVEVHVAVPNE